MASSTSNQKLIKPALKYVKENLSTKVKYIPIRYEPYYRG